jgi:hypothetical protein
MRRLAIVFSLVLAMLAVIPSAALGRGPQKNDSVSGHGLVVFSPTTTYDFRVSAHTISSTTTAATGNMYIKAVSIDPLSPVTVEIWADVFCVSVIGLVGEVRGHIYRTNPDILPEPTDLIFNVGDASALTNNALPDLFDATTGPVGEPCLPPIAPVNEVAKGDITVNDEL